MTVVPITPRMDLAYLSEVACCDRTEAAFVLLELIAEGHWAKDAKTLKTDAITYAVQRACERMDALEISYE